MDSVLSQEFGNSGFAAIRQPGFKAGQLFLECLYVVQAAAEKNLHAERYLPPTTIRVVVDMQGKDRHEALPHHAIQPIKQQIDKDKIRKIVISYTEKLREMMSVSEALATVQLPDILVSARQQVKQTLEVEIDRLQALQKINPNVRETEINHLEHQHQQILKMLDQSTLRLEAVRVLVTA